MHQTKNELNLHPQVRILLPETTGVSEDIIEASWQALIDSLEFKLNNFNKNK